MIASRNRRDELLKTLASCRDQDYPDKEIHVVDDGSTDGTVEAVARKFPEVVLTRNEQTLGSVESRNAMFRRVQGDILIGFDDDSRFQARGSTRRVVERFKREPDLGLLDFQDIGPEHPERIPADSPFRLQGERIVQSFGAGRYALRRAVLERTGLFPSFFWHSYEEPDLALRIWDAGFRCVGWPEIIVWHEFSGLNRNELRTHLLHARNEILSTLMRAPWPMVPVLIAWKGLRQVQYGLKRGWGFKEWQAWRQAATLAPEALKSRAPVRAKTLLRSLLMNRAEVAGRLGSAASRMVR